MEHYKNNNYDSFIPNTYISEYISKNIVEKKKHYEKKNIVQNAQLIL